jgi:hypothetical protein
MFGKNYFVRAAFGLPFHAFCHFIIVSSSSYLYSVLFGILLYVIESSLSLAAALAIWSARKYALYSFMLEPLSATVE